MKKKKEAILESKCILEQTESSMVNYGGAYSNFALAERSGFRTYQGSGFGCDKSS